MIMVGKDASSYKKGEKVMSKRIKVKPGKFQSKIGFCVGIAFCLIGLFMVIPVFGLFGIFWTAIAVVITVSNGINAFSEKGLSTHEIIIEDNDAMEASKKDQRADQPVEKENIELRLRKTEELYQSGVITEEEYESKRKDILKDL